MQIKHHLIPAFTGMYSQCNWKALLYFDYKYTHIMIVSITVFSRNPIFREFFKVW